MVRKQQVHLRKIGTKLVKAGKGINPTLIGKLVWYNKRAYTITRKNKNNTYDLRNLTARLEVHNIPRIKFKMYK